MQQWDVHVVAFNPVLEYSTKYHTLMNTISSGVCNTYTHIVHTAINHFYHLILSCCMYSVCRNRPTTNSTMDIIAFPTITSRKIHNKISETYVVDIIEIRRMFVTSLSNETEQAKQPTTISNLGFEFSVVVGS